MDQKTFLLNALKNNQGMLVHTLGDLTDADLFVRPCPGANHAAWQLGHLTCSEAGIQPFLSASKAAQLPAGFSDQYNMKANANDDPAQFAPFNTKAQLIGTFTTIREATMACVESMTGEQLDAATPEKYRAWAPTLGCS